MTKKIIYENSFLISGIMCYSGCGNAIKNSINRSFEECKEKKLFSTQAQLILDAEPQELGTHRVIITVSDNENASTLSKEQIKQIQDNFHDGLDCTGLDIITELKENNNKKSTWTNWINILVNLISIAAITTLALVFPPSLWLTIGLTSLSFLTTAFTSRTYLINFFHNLKHKNFANMTTTVSLGWLLSLGHTLYHAISMPLTSSFSMIFMSFIMPVMLITIINAMDELKRLILNKAQKMNLSSMKMLFPQMSDEYLCYQLPASVQTLLAHNEIEHILYPDTANSICSINLSGILDNKPPAIATPKNLIKKGMLLKINRGECFPVDCNLIQGNTMVDASLLTGEPQQSKEPPHFIPSGAINLGQTVTVYAREDAYNSTINKLLFRSNRAKDPERSKTSHQFTYLYTGLIVLGLAASLIVPLSLGILTIPLLLQNITGILFAVCPCTIAIGHQLPGLLNLYYCSKKGLSIRDKNLHKNLHEPHTIVFDKTGTLTTGNSQVESHTGIYPALWTRIYLLEQEQGAGHPLAKALISYYEKQQMPPGIIKDVTEAQTDPQHRGLYAKVQGKKIHIGSEAYLQHWNIPYPAPDKEKIDLGYTPIYVAEEGKYQGIIYIKHEIRKNILSALKRLKESGKRLIMLTGDNIASAKNFNKQHGSYFDPQNIHASQAPEKKETFLKEHIAEMEQSFLKQLIAEAEKSTLKQLIAEIDPSSLKQLMAEMNQSSVDALITDINEASLKKLMTKMNQASIDQLKSAKNLHPQGVWFIGDGLNDAPCAKMVTEKNGVSCSMTGEDKATFFADISLNGSLDYVFAHKELNQFIKKNKKQNQALLLYGALAFIAFIVSFSIAGIAVSPFIPLLVMMSTTFFVLFNSYRMPLKVDLCFNEHKTSWLKHLLASDLSLATLLTANTFLITALLVSTIATGGLSLPIIAFTTGLATAISSASFLISGALFGAFALGSMSYLITRKSTQISLAEEQAPEERPTMGISNKVTTSETKNRQELVLTPSLRETAISAKEGQDEAYSYYPKVI